MTILTPTLAARKHERALLAARIEATLLARGPMSFSQIRRHAVPNAHFRAVDAALQMLRKAGRITPTTQGPRRWMLVDGPEPDTDGAGRGGRTP